jgi:hypothetical protein
VLTSAAAQTPSGWLIPAISVLGTLLGTLVGSHLSRRRERLGWQREWLGDRITRNTEYAADVCRAIDTILVVSGQCADAVAGKRQPVPTGRVEAADAAWRDVLSTRRVFAHAGLQEALAAFDEARATTAEAINSREPEVFDAALQSLEAKHLQVLDEIQQDRNWINDALGHHILPVPVRFWRALRGRPSYPAAPLPSELRAAQDT